MLKFQFARLKNSPTPKPMIKMLIVTFSVLGAIVAYKAVGYYMMKKYLSGAHAPAVVSSGQVQSQPWQPLVRASGTLKATQGVEIRTEVSGVVQKIHFSSGIEVEAGAALVDLHSEVDVANWQSLKALAALSEATYNRDKKQYKAEAISQSTLDAGLADWQSKVAEAQAEAALVAKKNIVAPFKGRLGILEVNEGQYLNPGDKIVTLQALDKLYIDFYVPQQLIGKLKRDQSFILRTDAYPDQTFKGIINAIEAKVDPTTRMLHVQGTIENTEKLLLPGMFSAIEVLIDEPETHVTIPQSAIRYNPYGETVYVISEKGLDDQKKPIWVAHQTFITVGERRADEVVILKGLKAGERIVLSGQLKLKNGDIVTLKENPPSQTAIAAEAKKGAE